MFVIAYGLASLAVFSPAAFYLIQVVRRARAGDYEGTLQNRMRAVMSGTPAGRRWLEHPIVSTAALVLLALVIGTLIAGRLSRLSSGH